MAVDRSLWQFGTPMWIETHYPPEAEKPSPGLKRLMIAQDTGSAIRGAVRGDFYWGWGDEAALIAGHMKSPGRMTALLPHKVAARLGL
jgi:membrane-bound lytic murein transglycosylase A